MELHKRSLFRMCIGAMLATGPWLLVASAQQPQPAAAPPGRNRWAPDARVQQRTYRFQDTGEELPYAVFVSSKAPKGTKVPLIVALHGLNGNPNSLMRGPLLDLAEQGGYVVVAPMGYNSRGWYGIPWERPPGENSASARESAAAHDPANLHELSEKDVLDVLRMAQVEFDVDPQRIYLLGHSMGGAGALYLASKYPTRWTAVGAIAPATKRMLPEMKNVVDKIQAPLVIVQGDADRAVPVTMTRLWTAAFQSKHGAFEYEEIPGADHDSAIDSGMPRVFEFFAANDHMQR